MNSERIKAVIFDFGNVLALLDRDEMCRRLSAHTHLAPEEIGPRIFGGDIERDSETGAYDSHEMFKRVREAIEANDDWKYSEFVDEFSAGLTLNPEGVRALRYAAARCPTYVLSNTSYVHARWLFNREPLATVPTGYVLSFKVGVMKPDPRIWEIAMDRARAAPGACVYVDDIAEFAVAASRFGMRSIHYRHGDTDLLEALSELFRE